MTGWEVMEKMTELGQIKDVEDILLALETTRNTDTDRLLSIDFINITHFINSFCIWHLTPQGHDYWRRISGKWENFKMDDHLYIPKRIKRLRL